MLPDWKPQDISLLLARPIFDPATFGRVRLHNDNEGIVRSYLAARWLKRLRDANLPKRERSAPRSALRRGKGKDAQSAIRLVLVRDIHRRRCGPRQIATRAAPV